MLYMEEYRSSSVSPTLKKISDAHINMRKAFYENTKDRNSLYLIAPSIYLFVLPLAHTTALRSIAFGTSVLLLLMTWRAHRTPMIPLKAAFAIWFLIALLSLPWAIHPEFSMGEIRVEIIYGFLVFLIFFKATRTSQALTLWLQVAFASGLVTGLLALVHFLRGLDPYQVGALYGGALSYAGYMTIIMPLFAAIGILRSGSGQLAMLCLILFLLAIAFGTTNRGVWLYLFVELAVFGSLYILRINLEPKAKKAAIAIILGAMIGSTGALLLASKNRLGLAGGPAEIIAGTAKADLRPLLWHDTIAWIKKRPFTGAGFGTMVLGKELQEQQKNPNHTHAHNMLLNYALQLGLLGPIVFLFIFYSVGREFWKLVKSADKELQIFGIAGITILSGIFASGMIEDLFLRHIGWLFWALVGVMLGYAKNKCGTVSVSRV